MHDDPVCIASREVSGAHELSAGRKFGQIPDERMINQLTRVQYTETERSNRDG